MKILKDLFLAMINATLLLVALCLFLLWQLSGTAQQIASDFAGNLKGLQPIATEINGLRGELDSLRADLVNAPRTLQTELSTRLDNVDARLAGLDTRLQTIAQTPDRLMTVAIDQSSTRIMNGIYRLRGCTAPSEPVSPDLPRG